MQLNRSLLVCCLVAGIATQFTLVTAQENPAQESPAATVQRRGPLPYFFGKLGLTNKQRDEMYSLQAQYEEEIESLQLKIERLVQERDQKLEEMLTPGQKLRLKELRTEAEKRKAKTSNDADNS